MSEVRFEVILASEAADEYAKLDNSVIGIVNKAIDELEVRADSIGKTLGNRNNSKLAGCKEIKLREAGVRIVFRVTKHTVHVLQVVYVLAIERRSREIVFKLANKRYNDLNVDTETAVGKGKGWHGNKRRKPK
jgi:mRNA interferase RelE/StbE